MQPGLYCKLVLTAQHGELHWLGTLTEPNNLGCKEYLAPLSFSRGITSHMRVNLTSKNRNLLFARQEMHPVTSCDLLLHPSKAISLRLRKLCVTLQIISFVRRGALVLTLFVTLDSFKLAHVYKHLNFYSKFAVNLQKGDYRRLSDECCF